MKNYDDEILPPNSMIILWWTYKGDVRYRCRGTGETYRKFFNDWVPKSSYRNTGRRGRWDFFNLVDPKDHDRLLKQYPAFVIEDND